MSPNSLWKCWARIEPFAEHFLEPIGRFFVGLFEKGVCKRFTAPVISSYRDDKLS